MVGSFFFFLRKKQDSIRQLAQHTRWLQDLKQTLGSPQAKHNSFQTTPEKHQTELVDAIRLQSIGQYIT